MVLNDEQIEQAIIRGLVKDHDPNCINGTSLDVRLGRSILVEVGPGHVIDYRSRGPAMNMEEVEIGDEGYILTPGQFILAHTIEVVDLPISVSALFRIKSSQGRIGFEHMDAGWVDAMFNGSLTLEFKNMLQFHSIRIRPGDPIGQLIFMKHEPVSDDRAYHKKGRYGGSSTVEQVK